MYKITYCLLATILIGIYLSMLAVIHKSDMFQKFRKSLTNYQKDKYIIIVRERSRIFYTAITLSLIISGLLSSLLVNYNNNNNNNIICFFIASCLSLTTLIYLFYPKTDYMIKYLNTSEQRNSWLAINNSFKKAKYIGLLTGTIGYFISATYLSADK